MKTVLVLVGLVVALTYAAMGKENRQKFWSHGLS